MAQRDDPLDKRFHDREDREKRRQKQLPTDDDAPLPPPVEPIHADAKPGRNDPCPCGSGKKYKQCCAKKQTW